ncbi:MAG: C13 family peptidase [Pseudomonadota bacterium]
MENISVSTVLTMDDWRALSAAARQRLWTPASRWRRWLLRAPFILLVLMLLGGMLLMPTDPEIRAFVIGIFGTFLLGAIQAQIAGRGADPMADGMFLGPTRFVFGADGIQWEHVDSSAHVAWAKVLEIEATSTHVFLWVAVNSGYAVPARDLSGGLNATILAQRLRAFIADAKAGGALVAASNFSVPPPAPDTLPSPLHFSIAQQLAAAGKLLLLLRADAARLAGSDGAIALLGAMALALWLPLDRLIFPGPMDFVLEQIGGLSFVIAGALALAWIAGRLSVPRIEYRRALLVVTASMFIAIAGSASFNLFAERWFPGTLVALAAAAYATLFFKRALRTLTGFVQTRALLVGAVATFVFVLTMDRLYITPSLWAYPDEDGAGLDGGANYQDAWRRIEDLQFDQRARIDAQVAGIAAQSAADAQVYFVGFAGYGEQRVFAQEIGLAAKQVAQRYDAGEREILLVNDRRDLEKYPLATARALRHTLVSLGKVMDADDVLFLALSSHGDEDATLSVSNAGMMPGELDSGQVADALRESGIRWKVIVISACHAGSFIEALADDHTIVLTAAAADRTSFGCADDRDLTYFGEAFYRDALPKAASLRAAFEAAKASIAQREKAEGIDASNPQASYGAAIEAKLAGIETAAGAR